MHALVLLLLAISTGSGTRLTETRKIAAFTEIDVSDGLTLEVKKGPTSLTIEGDDNLVPLYVTEVVDGRLRIHRKKGDWVRPVLKVIVRVTTPSLERLEASGGVNARLENVAARKFSATLSGGVEFEAKDLELDVFDLDASGGGTARLGGHAKRAKLDLSGGVGVKAKELEIARASVDASGGCDVELTAKESISGEASGGVALKVYGKPAKAQVETSGGSGVQYVE